MSDAMSQNPAHCSGVPTVALVLTSWTRRPISSFYGEGGILLMPSPALQVRSRARIPSSWRRDKRQSLSVGCGPRGARQLAYRRWSEGEGSKAGAVLGFGSLLPRS